tara:strand:+ start:140929 stop:141084 length:156 start_codon:yes stop_codon:yes gene_type:complete
MDDIDSGYCNNCGDYREVDLVVDNDGNVYCDDECLASATHAARPLGGDEEE